VCTRIKKDAGRVSQTLEGRRRAAPNECAKYRPGGVARPRVSTRPTTMACCGRVFLCSVATHTYTVSPYRRYLSCRVYRLRHVIAPPLLARPRPRTEGVLRLVPMGRMASSSWFSSPSSSSLERTLGENDGACATSTSTSTSMKNDATARARATARTATDVGPRG